MNHTALLLIDIQNDYFEGGSQPLHQPLAAALNAQQLLNHFRSHHLPVVHIQHEATRPEATFFKADTIGIDIHSTVAPIANEKVIVKHFPNSFRETELLSHLQHLQVNHLVVGGMMTHMCVDATVRAAKDLGFIITLIGDACATKDLSVFDQTVKADEVQTALLAALNYFYATVIKTRQFVQEFK